MTTINNETPVFVATYGSLRRKMGNHGVNARAGGTVVGLGRTVQNADLYQYCGGFPSVSLAHQDAENTVRVEVYQTTEAGLFGPYDSLEGYPHFYNRTEVPVKMDDGRELKCWIYHIDEETGPLVHSGDWCTHKCGDEYYDDLDRSDV